MTARLEFLEVWIPERMDPGTVFLLAKQTGLESGQNAFVAVLSCPRCGTMGLITRHQLRQGAAMICGNDACSAEFLLEGEEIRFRKPQ